MLEYNVTLMNMQKESDENNATIQMFKVRIYNECSTKMLVVNNLQIEQIFFRNSTRCPKNYVIAPFLGHPLL